MAVITDSTTFDTPFTPAVGDFLASSTDRATLKRKNNSSAAYCVIARLKDEGVIVENPVAGAVYIWEAGDPTASVSADQ